MALPCLLSSFLKFFRMVHSVKILTAKTKTAIFAPISLVISLLQLTQTTSLAKISVAKRQAISSATSALQRKLPVLKESTQPAKKNMKSGFREKTAVCPLMNLFRLKCQKFVTTLVLTTNSPGINLKPNTSKTGFSEPVF